MRSEQAASQVWQPIQSVESAITNDSPGIPQVIVIFDENMPMNVIFDTHRHAHPQTGVTPAKGQSLSSCCRALSLYQLA